MFLLPLAFAGDPSPPPPPPTTPACAQGQRCGDRCIPWTEVCPTTLAHALDTVEEQKKNEALAEALCVPLPDPDAPKPASVESQILLSAAAGAMCSSELRTNPDACADANSAPVARPTAPPPQLCRPAVVETKP